MNRLGIDLSPRRTAELSQSLHDISQGKKQAPEVLEETRPLGFPSLSTVTLFCGIIVRNDIADLKRNDESSITRHYV
ncbi:MAG: hypothetical protein K6A90_04830 [Lachnospiraceae bacterium]|nr:hypothetical protein [Lachnospiraceae bacterium]